MWFSFKASERTERQVRNATDRRLYQKAPELPKTQAKPQEPKKSPYSPRAILPPVEASKLNISLLFTEKNEALYDLAATLIEQLYQNQSFYKPELNYKILDAILLRVKTIKEPKEWTELYPEDPALKPIFYKMLKGTNHYTLQTGIPPLSDFISIAKEKKENSISFTFASPPLLEALFNSQLASEILTFEKKNGKPCAKEDLQNLLSKDSQVNFPFTQMEPLMNFNKQLPAKKKIAGTDKLTGITITRKC